MSGNGIIPYRLYYPKIVVLFAKDTLQHDFFLDMIEAMSTNPQKNELPPYTGNDLERWRLVNGLSKPQAANAFGLPQAKWIELTSLQNGDKPLTDPVLAMLLQLYDQHPESAPIPRETDVKAFYEYLGLKDSPRDRERFASLIGRSAPSVYRLLLHDGNAGRPVASWIEAVRRLNLAPAKALKLMRQVAEQIAQRQRLDKAAISDIPEPD